MAVTGVWRIAVIGLGPKGEGIVNTFHAGVDGNDPVIVAQDVADAADGNLATAVAPLLTSDWSYLKTTALCVHGVNIGLSAESAVSAPLAGALTPPSAPMTVAAIGRRRSNAPGRHSRGRCFFSPIPASSVDVNGKFTGPGTWDADWGALNATQLNVGGETLIQVLWDTVNSQAQTILTGDTAKQIGVQRRRRLRQPN